MSDLLYIALMFAPVLIITLTGIYMVNDMLENIE